MPAEGPLPAQRRDLRVPLPGRNLNARLYQPAPQWPRTYAWATQQRQSLGCARLAVAGDSAGGHLAAHAMAANPELDTAAALLLYPVAGMDFKRYGARAARLQHQRQTRVQVF